MGKRISLEKAASETAIKTKPRVLVRVFKKILHAQFSKIKHGCIILNEDGSRIIFGDETASLKTEVTIFLSLIHI